VKLEEKNLAKYFHGALLFMFYPVSLIGFLFFFEKRSYPASASIVVNNPFIKRLVNKLYSSQITPSRKVKQPAKINIM
jgi:hypothetical protein